MYNVVIVTAFFKRYICKTKFSGCVPSTVAWSKLKFADFRSKYCGFFIQNKDFKHCKSVKCIYISQANKVFQANQTLLYLKCS